MLEYEIVGRIHAGAVYVKTKYGTQVWIRGFVFKDWTCAVTGKIIRYPEYAWRIWHPYNREEEKLRVMAPVFDAPSFHIAK